MRKILDEQKTQYWFWFIRKILIDYELEDISNNRGVLANKLISKVNINNLDVRRDKLLQLMAKPTTQSIYSREAMANWIFELSNNKKISDSFSENGDDFKNGSMPIPEKTVIFLDDVLPSSLQAYNEGPSGLFLILEAQTLLESLYILAEQLLKLLKSNLNKLHKSETLLSLTKSLEGLIKLGIFGGNVKLLRTVEDIFNYLFPNNNWDKFTLFITTLNDEKERFNRLQFHQETNFHLESLAPILVGYAFFRARHFNETHYLARVCYEEGCLKILKNNFLISEEHWRFDTDRKDSAEMVNKGRHVIRHLFRRAFVLTKPILPINVTPTE